MTLLTGNSSREVSKPRDSGLDFSNRSQIWQAPRQQRCRDACQISERYDHYNIQSRGFETSRDLAVRRLTAYRGPDSVATQYWLQSRCGWWFIQRCLLSSTVYYPQWFCMWFLLICFLSGLVKCCFIHIPLGNCTSSSNIPEGYGKCTMKSRRADDLSTNKEQKDAHIYIHKPSNL